MPAKVDIKSVFIHTLGCPKNEVDSLVMQDSIQNVGYKICSNAADADYILINTCTFIEEANIKTIDSIFESIALKQSKLTAHTINQNNKKVIVAGCFAERYKKQLEQDIPEVDFIFGTGKYEKAGSLIRDHFNDHNIVQKNTDNKQNYIFPNKIPYNYNPNFNSIENNRVKTWSFIKLSDGCNRKCSFCIIPSIRGRFKEYSSEALLRSLQVKIDSGYKEIGLVSQDLNRYHNLNKLLNDMSSIILKTNRQIWLRLYYLYPDKKTEDLLHLFAEIPYLVPYLDMPLQHISAGILKKMQRSGNIKYYKKLFEKFRKFNPDGEIRTSFIIGYPGENSTDIDTLKKFIKEVQPEKLALFSFSPQSGTAAEKLKIYPSHSVAIERLNDLKDYHQEIIANKYRGINKRRFTVLLDSEDENYFYGHRMQDAPEIDYSVTIAKKAFNKNKIFNYKPGDFAEVEINDFYQNDFTGDFI